MRNDYAPDLRVALDTFAAPEPPELLADRIAGATQNPRPRRDRRGAWRIVRRGAIGMLAAGMVSAAAVASGLLGAAGIHVPVLTAMLAPERKPVVPQRAAKPRPVKVVRKPIVETEPAVALADPPALSPLPPMPTRVARILERRAARRAFVAEHPEVVPVVREALHAERQFVRANPDVRTLRRLPLADRPAFLETRPALRDAIAEHRAERRAFIAANPEARAVLRERRRAMRAKMAEADPLPETVERNASDPR